MADKTPTLPVNSIERKRIPLCTGVLDYFPAALAEVAKVSRAGNEKHNPGQPLHWSREKSTDHADCILRHLAERGTVDSGTGCRHSAELAWRALALLQEELEAEGAAPPSRGSTFPVPQQSLPPDIVTCDVVASPHDKNSLCVNARPAVGRIDFICGHQGQD